jgi:hypothetical protein
MHVRGSCPWLKLEGGAEACLERDAAGGEDAFRLPSTLPA